MCAWDVTLHHTVYNVGYTTDTLSDSSCLHIRTNKQTIAHIGYRIQRLEFRLFAPIFVSWLPSFLLHSVQSAKSTPDVEFLNEMWNRVAKSSAKCRLPSSKSRLCNPVNTKENVQDQNICTITRERLRMMMSPLTHPWRILFKNFTSSLFKHCIDR